MKLKLRNQLILSYFVLAMFIIGIISFMMNVSVRKGFENYIIEEHDQLVSELLKNIRFTYSKKDGFDIGDIEHIGIEAIEKGLIISVHGTNNETIWSAMEHNAGLCEAMMTNVKKNMFNHYANWEGNYTEESFDIKMDNQKIGFLKVGYLGPFYFNEEELYFLTSINRVLAIVGVLALTLAIFIGVLIARGVTRPIESVINYLNQIHGNNDVTIPLNINNTYELHALFKSAISLEHRIHEQESLRKQLTQDMAHELKTPLTSIQGQMEAMLDGIFPITEERLNSCYEEIIRIKALINEIELLSIIENNNTELHFTFFNLQSLITDVITNFETTLTNNKMTMTIQYGKNYLQKSYNKFHGDSDKIRQVLINLTSNAIKYAGENTNIEVVLNNTSNGDYRIHFKDNGQGIHSKDIPFIFERFYRADPSRTGNNGIGIGLTLVKSIITKHAGTIWYNDNNLSGAEFIITFPANARRRKV